MRGCGSAHQGDPSAAARGHPVGQQRRHRRRGDEVRLRQPDDLRRRLDQRAGRQGVALSGDEQGDVEGFGRVPRLQLHESGFRIGQIERADIGLGPCRAALRGETVERVRIASPQRKPRPLPRELHRKRAAECPGCAGEQNVKPCFGPRIGICHKIVTP